MKLNRLLLASLIYGALIGISSFAGAWEPGTYAQTSSGITTYGFTVDNQDRNDVISFWHAVYQASEGYEDRIEWNGNFTGNSGKVSGAFIDDMERRLNYFRAMVGVPANAKVNSGAKVAIYEADPFKPPHPTKKEDAAQDAALMLVRNYNSTTGAAPALTHNPQPGLIGWSEASWNACAKSNFAFGLYGPGALTEYMIEKLSNGSTTSSWNSLVGHRRWCLYPPATDFATGDQPGSTALRPPTNVFYVIQNENELAPPAAKFVAYPSPGFFPAAINTPYWSLSHAGADFSQATVKMTDAQGNIVPLTNVNSSDSYGDPALIWQVSPVAASSSVFNDTLYNIKVSDISLMAAAGGVPTLTSHSYSVILINPNRLLSSQKLVGPATVPVNKSGLLTLDPPSRAESLQIVASKKQTSAWLEDAEKPNNARVIDGTGENYPLIAKTSFLAGFGSVSGSYAFRLTFPTSYDAIVRGVPEQSFEIDREIIAKTGAKLKFTFRRGYMTRSTSLVIEKSADAGVTWKQVGSPIKGVSDTKFDAAISSASVSLPKSATPIRLRFRYFTSGGSIYTHEAAPTFPTGIFLDDITTSGCEWLEPKKVNYLAATSTTFEFDSKNAGAKLAKGDVWYLAMRTRLGGKWFPRGPVKPVTVVAP